MFNITIDSKSIIGMIHVDPLPGTPKSNSSLTQTVAKAKQEALLYKEAGIDALAIENMHDIPYLKKRVGPEITAAMTVIGYEVKQAANLPCGIQILAGANEDALAAAVCTDSSLVNVPGSQRHGCGGNLRWGARLHGAH